MTAADSEVDPADPTEFSQSALGGEVLVVDVGVSNISSDQSFVDEGFDHGGVNTDSDVAFDSLFAPVPNRAQVEEVFQGPEPGLDVEELPVGTHDPGG